MDSSEINYWQAVQARDADFDGVFFYGVRSTGIYCRPSCPSRKPLRKNVIFFAELKSAQQSGFRPCLRCSPERENSTIQEICRALDAACADGEARISLQALSIQFNLSESHLQRSFKKVMGISPRQYLEAKRIEKFKAASKNSADVITAMYEAGYSSGSRLYEKSSSQLGMTPATYRNQGKNMTINYVIVDCNLGKLLVATTERGICSVTLGDEEKSLQQELSKEFSRAEIRVDGTSLKSSVTEILAHLEGKQPRLNLPLDVQATAFQKMVWEELQRIPYGQTASYSQVAERLGKPSATRAVARACATNPVALITPCHRVVRSDGNLSGYRWGVERKKKLLEQENKYQRG